MKTYGDIINRIREIIKYSEDRKRELPKDKIGENFSKILFQDIANECAEEFRSLLITEMVFYKIHNTPNADQKNAALLLECEKKGSIPNDNTDGYLELMTILRNAQNQLPSSLTEYMGYFVLKNEITDFIRLCRKLNIGPCKKIIDMQSAQAKKAVMDSLDEKKTQFSRIKFSMEQPQVSKKAPAKSFKREKQQVKAPVPETSTAEIPKKEETSKLEMKSEIINIDENPTYLNGKYKALVYLGISGKLTMDMVVQAKDALSQAEFKELLEELNKYGVYSQEQIDEIIELSAAKTRSINGIDEFIAYMILREGLDLQVLKEVVIQLYGYENYHYFMDKLYEYGKISFEEYLPSVNELISNRRRK